MRRRWFIDTRAEHALGYNRCTMDAWLSKQKDLQLRDAGEQPVYIIMYENKKQYCKHLNNILYLLSTHML